MQLLVLTVAWAACLLPAHSLQLWRTNNDYINFLVMKSCLGMDVALKLEKLGYEASQSCQEGVENAIDSIINLFTNESQNRRKRGILKLPRRASPAVVMCHLRELQLLTDNNKMNYSVVEEELRKLEMDEQLKQDLLDTAALCRVRQAPIQDLLPEGSVPDAVSAMISAMGYLQCLTGRGLHACVRHERRRYASWFDQSQPPVTSGSPSVVS